MQILTEDGYIDDPSQDPYQRADGRWVIPNPQAVPGMPIGPDGTVDNNTYATYTNNMKQWQDSKPLNDVWSTVLPALAVAGAGGLALSGAGTLGADGLVSGEAGGAISNAAGGGGATDYGALFSDPTYAGQSAGMDAITTGQSVNPWTTNASVDALGGGAGSAANASAVPDWLKNLFSTPTPPTGTGGSSQQNALAQILGLGGNSLGGTALSAIGSILAGKSQASAADKAALLSAYAAQQASAQQQPYSTAGVNALGQLSAGTQPGGDLIRPFGEADFKADPGYGFRLGEGMKALERSAAARGGLLSGSALKGITRYGQDFASNEYQNAYNRYGTNQTNQFNRLASIAGLGQTANNSLANIGMQNAGNAGTAALVGGQSRASTYAGIGNALGRTNFNNLFGTEKQPINDAYSAWDTPDWWT